MYNKKSKRADLNRGSSTYFMMGLVVALSLFFVALEWNSPKGEVGYVPQRIAHIVWEDIQITPPEEDEPAVPDEPQRDAPPAVVENLTIVENTMVVDDVQIMAVDDAIDKMQLVFTPPQPTSGRGREELSEQHVYEFVEELPQFPGGEAALLRWLQNNIIYPPVAAEYNIQGRVEVSFVVERNGGVSDVKVVKSVDEDLDAEAVRVTSAMPKWKPGMQDGKPVRTRYTIPITFRLQ